MTSMTGGCQCGSVRYWVDGALSNPHLCHCRMCQKAAGNYFMPLAKARNGGLRITRGEVSWFQSSDQVRRGFCRNCGTPLIFDVLGGSGPNITLGSLDEPSAVKPVSQSALESKIVWLDELKHLPSDSDGDVAWFAQIAKSNHQHPDHDTETWPPEKSK